MVGRVDRETLGRSRGGLTTKIHLLADAALFWVSLAGSLAIALVLTTPINRWLMAKGKGHAVVRAHH